MVDQHFPHPAVLGKCYIAIQDRLGSIVLNVIINGIHCKDRKVFLPDNHMLIEIHSHRFQNVFFLIPGFWPSFFAAHTDCSSSMEWKWDCTRFFDSSFLHNITRVSTSKERKRMSCGNFSFSLRER